MIKQNELELANIDFEIVSCFEKLSTACISGTNQPIFMGGFY